MTAADLYAYRVETIEITWDNLTSCDDYRKKLAIAYSAEEDRPTREEHLSALVKFESFFKSALEAARRIGSEGNFLVAPHIGFLPGNARMCAYLVWRDDDHGSTFIVSPIEMRWLTSH